MGLASLHNLKALVDKSEYEIISLEAFQGCVCGSYSVNESCLAVDKCVECGMVTTEQQT